MNFFKENLKSRIEFGTLLGSGEPPWWFRFSIFMQGQWSNPIFQRNYVRKRIGMVPAPGKVLVGFLLGSYLFNMGLIYSLLKLGMAWDDALLAGFYLCMILIPGVLYLYLLVKLFIACLVTTSAQMRTNLGSEEPDAIMTTPLPDKDFFFGETLPNFVGGVDLSLIFGAINFAMALPFAFVIVVPYVIFKMHEPNLLWLLPLAITGFAGYTALLIFNVILMMLLISYAVGRWIVGYSVFAAIALGLMHYLVVNFLAAIVTLIMGAFGLVVRYFIVIFAIGLTARTGVTLLGKFRRQGEYHPGWVISDRQATVPEWEGKPWSE